MPNIIMMKIRREVDRERDRERGGGKRRYYYDIFSSQMIG